MKHYLPSITLLAPRAPTLFSLARSAQLREAAEQSRKRPSESAKGLFECLVGEPRALYYEMLEDPSRFEEGAVELVQMLVTGQRQSSSLSPAERTLLDHATLDWARPRHRHAGGSTSGETPVRSEAIDHLTFQDLLDDPNVDLVQNEDGTLSPLEPEPVVPEEKPDTFWWRS
jgi:hypothetical protein